MIRPKEISHFGLGNRERAKTEEEKKKKRKEKKKEEEEEEEEEEKRKEERRKKKREDPRYGTRNICMETMGVCIYGLEPSILCMVWVWELLNSFLVWLS